MPEIAEILKISDMQSTALAGGGDLLNENKAPYFDETVGVLEEAKDVKSPDIEKIATVNELEQPLVTQDDKTNLNEIGTDDKGQAFYTWMIGRINTKEMVVNKKGARFYFTEEGLFIISPDAFKLFDEADWKTVQKEFVRMNLNKVDEGTRANLFQYRIKATGTRLLGYLIKPPEKIYKKRQKINEILEWGGPKVVEEQGPEKVPE